MSRTQPFAPHNAMPFFDAIINPVSVDGTKVYVRCIDGKMKGRHVWVERNSYSYQFQSASSLKPYYHSSDKVGPTFKIHVYFVKKHEFCRPDGTRTIIYYLGIKQCDPFDDLSRLFGPKTG